jgi:biotin synthase-related radical SAM superfamily protein
MLANAMARLAGLAFNRILQTYEHKCLSSCQFVPSVRPSVSDAAQDVQLVKILWQGRQLRSQT